MGGRLQGMEPMKKCKTKRRWMGTGNPIRCIRFSRYSCSYMPYDRRGQIDHHPMGRGPNSVGRGSTVSRAVRAVDSNDPMGRSRPYWMSAIRQTRAVNPRTFRCTGSESGSRGPLRTTEALWRGGVLLRPLDDARPTPETRPSGGANRTGTPAIEVPMGVSDGG